MYINFTTSLKIKYILYKFFLIHCALCHMLQDVIWNENINLDEMFKYSIAIDLMKVGLNNKKKNVC